MRNWKEIAEDYEKVIATPTPRLRKYKPDYVFDEEKSVRWNREQVEKENAAADKMRLTYNEERERKLRELDADILNNILDESEKGISLGTATVIFNYARNECHGNGINSVLNKIQELIEFVDKVLGSL